MTFLLLRWFSRWPLAWARAVGAGLGWLTWCCSPTYRRRLTDNTTRAGLTTAQRRGAVADAGRMMAEVPWIWFRPASRPLGELLEWDGAEQVEQALDQGKGLLLITPHLGGFEFAARGYAERFGARQPITVLYRPARQPWLAEVQKTAREAPGMKPAAASLSGVRQMLRALRRGETLGLLPDQVPPEGQGVWAPFFGRPAYTMTLASRLVQQTGCAVLLTWCERLPGGRGFRLVYRPLPAPLTEADDEASARAVNQAMEWAIGHCPSQYLWGYHRYKSPRQTEASAPEQGA